MRAQRGGCGAQRWQSEAAASSCTFLTYPMNSVNTNTKYILKQIQDMKSNKYRMWIYTNTEYEYIQIQDKLQHHPLPSSPILWNLYIQIQNTLETYIRYKQHIWLKFKSTKTNNRKKQGICKCNIPECLCQKCTVHMLYISPGLQKLATFRRGQKWQ